MFSRALKCFTALCAVSLLISPGVAQAIPSGGDNTTNLRIPLNEGSVSTLTILQEGTGGNSIGTGTATVDAYTFTGPWNGISITQDGGGNEFTGSAASQAGGAGNLTATYMGNGNIQTLVIGDQAGMVPLNPNVTITVTGAGNILTDTLNTPLALTLVRNVLGNGNTLTNTITAMGNVTINEDVRGSGNSVVRTLTVGGSLNALALINGDGNTLQVLGDTAGDLEVRQGVGFSRPGGSISLASVPAGYGVGNTLTVNLATGSSGNRVVEQVIDGGPVAGPAGLDRNTMTANLSGDAGTGPGLRLNQRIGATGSVDDNVFVATLSGADQRITQAIDGPGRVDGGPGSFNTFNVTSPANNSNMNVRWRGTNAQIDVTQTLGADNGRIVWSGEGANVGSGAPGTGASVTITQTGSGNSIDGTATANPGTFLTVNINQN